MEEVRLNMMMMGKTGNGKSATANTILNRKVYKTNSSTTSHTKEVSYGFAIFDNHVLLVVDGPGLEDTDLTQGKDKEEAVRNMDTALAMCYGGVDAFLVVFRFGCNITREDRSALDALKQIFGDSFMNHVIVVLTCGDQFQSTMEEENRTISFHDWCREQTGEFRQLLKDCDDRIVLINNRETDDVKKWEQVRQIIQLTLSLQTKSGRYTSECFKLAEQEHRKLILNHKAPQLRLEFQEKIFSLNAEIKNLSASSSDSDKEIVRERIMDLKVEIEAQDEDCDVFQDLLILIENLEKNLNDVETLLILNKKLESIRRARTSWTVLGVVCTIFGGALVLVQPDAGKVVVSSTTMLIGPRLTDLQKQEQKIEQKKKEIKEQKKVRPTTIQDERKSSQRVSQSQSSMEKREINFVLLGKTGNGQSATGNMILSRRVFKTANIASSLTNCVDYSRTTYGQHNVLVVDQPGLCNTEMNKIDGTKAAVNNLSTALELCHGSVDAFLLVFNFGEGFTHEDKCMMRALKQIMGARFMDHVIVVMTGGDNYEMEMEHDNCVMSFDEWCQTRSGLHELYDDCEGRVMLFNNNEKNENKKREQIEKLLQVTQDLTNRRGRYTSKDFENARVQRDRFMLELDVCENRRSIVEKIRLLEAGVNNLTDQARFSELLSTRQLVQELKHEMEVKDGGNGFYADFQTLVDNLESGVEEIIAASLAELFDF